MGKCQSKTTEANTRVTPSTHDNKEINGESKHPQSTGQNQKGDRSRESNGKHATNKLGDDPQPDPSQYDDSYASAVQFAEEVWRHNSQDSLRAIMAGKGADYLRKFLEQEYSDDHLSFYQHVEQIKQAKQNGTPLDREAGHLRREAVDVYNKFLRPGSSQDLGFPSEIRCSSISDDPYPVLEEAQDEVVKMMAMDCFPRFLQSEECQKMLQDLQDSKLQEMVGKSKEIAPRGRKEWLGMFKSIADLLPTCIVIADKMAAGLPIVFVNEAFTRTTKYSRREAEGRNCRFLQGPETDPEAVEMIRSNIARNRECHVNILNYRKNGEKFQNLLSLKPVIGPYGECEYYIGVQYEITNASMMVTQLLQHEQLLKMLPSKISILEH
eukprot:gb/GECG01007344.1/.p1 GENE.gb/GECG01007344.1/~~gb/GECG01007344.1/.p1  ORF type:complete len:381 (+),score=58.72 gb/GECG01007344.1/:1-1143(+)